MLSYQDREKLLTIVSRLPMDFNNPLDIICCYTISTLILDTAHNRSLDYRTVKQYLQSDVFANHSSIYSLDTCIDVATAVSSTDNLFEFCSLLVVLGLRSTFWHTGWLCT